MKITQADKEDAAVVLEALAMILRDEKKKKIVDYLKDETDMTEAKATKLYNSVKKGTKIKKE